MALFSMWVCSLSHYREYRRYSTGKVRCFIYVWLSLHWLSLMKCIQFIPGLLPSLNSLVYMCWTPSKGITFTPGSHVDVPGSCEFQIPISREQCTLPTDQLFNLEFQFESTFNVDFQPEFGIQLGNPISMGIHLGECGCLAHLTILGLWWGKTRVPV